MLDRNKSVLYLAACYFPYGEASSARTLNLCKLIHSLGYDVHVLADFGVDSGGCPEFTYEYIFKGKSKYNLLTAGKQCIKRVKHYLKANKVDIIVSNARADRIKALKSICKKNKIKLIVENCEWYDSSSFKFGKLDFRYLANEKMFRKGFRGIDGFISISRLLHEHNLKFGRSARIPTILDFNQYQLPTIQQEDSGKIKLIYVGNPGKGKELFEPIFFAFSNPIIRNNFILDIYGPSESQVKSCFADMDLFEAQKHNVFFHGKIYQTKVEKKLREAQFLIFLRPDRKSSHAGFPTKLAESMAVGTPVITNKTGDIELYIKNGINGYLIDKSDGKSLELILLDILKNRSGYFAMRENSYKTAKSSFDLTNYQSDLRYIFDGTNVKQ